MRWLFITLTLFFLSGECLSKPKIAWFSTLQSDLSEKSGFWSRVHDLVISASEDLDVELKVYYAEENYIRLIEQVESVLSSPELRPDGIIFHNYKRTGSRILEIAEKHGVKSVIFNSGFNNSVDADLNPRKKYKHWIGQILPDDKYAGAELFRKLSKAAKQLPSSKKNETIKVLAMEGNLSSAAYQARKTGFQEAFQKCENVEFTQFIPADWSREIARKKFDTIVTRYPDVKVLWAANDNMALGLIDAAGQRSQNPGKDFVVGGIDWLPESFWAVKNGQMTVTIGGHFVEGMWALILLYDYLNGFDFAEHHDTTLKTQMLAVDKELLARYGDLTQKLKRTNLSALDFRLLSRTHTKGANYQFDIEHLLGLL